MSYTVYSQTIPERSSAQYTGTLTDEAGDVVPVASLLSAALTLYDEASGTILNSRNAQDVLNANDVTIDAAGLLTWQIQSDDTIIVDDTLAREAHRALFNLVAIGGTRITHEVRMIIVNLGQLT